MNLIMHKPLIQAALICTPYAVKRAQFVAPHEPNEKKLFCFALRTWFSSRCMRYMALRTLFS